MAEVNSFLPEDPARKLFARAIPATRLPAGKAESIIDGIIYPGKPTLLTGSVHHEVFTAFSVHIACHIATGDPWADRHVSPRNVLYVSTSTTARISGFIHAWEQTHEAKERLVNLSVLRIEGDAVPYDLLQKIAEEHDVFPVIDALDFKPRPAEAKAMKGCVIVADALSASYGIWAVHDLNERMILLKEAPPFDSRITGNFEVTNPVGAVLGKYHIRACHDSAVVDAQSLG